MKEVTVNAGIFLFLHYIKEAKAIKVESKYEDIEITLKNSKKVFAQAKFSQDECSAGNAKNKFKDAIVSLSKIPMQDNNTLIYISNVREPIKGGDKFFENKVVEYDECLTSIKINIEKGIEEIVKRLDKKIQSKSVSEQQNLTNQEVIYYSLPSEHEAFLAYIFCYDNVKVLKNLLGIIYVDQDKGWSLLNRGKVIGKIGFSIEELLAGLNNVDCDELLAEKLRLESEKRKYTA